LDSDGDGVADYLDQCPDTPKGAAVNNVGCWAFEGVVLFDFDRYEIRPEAEPLLEEVVSILKQNSEIKVEIQGHTCNIGSAAYNQKLSENRAQAVMDYLVRHGIPSYRLTAKGYGLTEPVASNETEEGRAKNRRVELSVR
jgi:OOP family OmpA-OmpF porin